MRVIATAGHVDHGKSTLVQRLTGVDPDRWDEEKRRGLTIDLGFAGMTLPGGEKLAFVDVPGHRRFIGNMLAGLGPAPLVMFVVAADQGWQAQSSEHLDAVAALGISDGLLVLTRCDLASPEQVAATREEALRHLASTPLAHARCVETDAVSGRGMDELRRVLDQLVEGLPPVDSVAPLRYWVDRSFSVKGVGTVVTGTLTAGTVRVGDEVFLAGRSTVVRSLETLGERVESVGPVARVAMALRGVDRADVPRGTPVHNERNPLRSSVIDVRAETGRPWDDSSEHVSIHVGTANVPARVRPLGGRFARLTLAAPLEVQLGDRLLVRDDSAGRIQAGVSVLDLDPATLVRRGAAARRAEQLAGWQTGDVAALAADRGAVETGWLLRAGASPHGAEPGLSLERLGEQAGWLVSARQSQRWVGAAAAIVEQDAQDPLSPGVALSVLAQRAAIPTALVEAIVTLAGFEVVAGRVRGASHSAGLGAADAALEELRKRLQINPFGAPEADELAELGLDAKPLAAAAERGLILRLRAQPADIVLLPDAPARAMRELAQLGQPFTTSQARGALNTTRRVVIPLLEHLDARGWTRRDGSVRFVVR